MKQFTFKFFKIYLNKNFSINVSRETFIDNQNFIVTQNVNL